VDTRGVCVACRDVGPAVGRVGRDPRIVGHRASVAPPRRRHLVGAGEVVGVVPDRGVVARAGEGCAGVVDVRRLVDDLYAAPGAVPAAVGGLVGGGVGGRAGGVGITRADRGRSVRRVPAGATVVGHRPAAPGEGALVA